MGINPKDPNIDTLPSAYDTTNSDRFEAKINRNPSFNMTDTPTRVTAEWGNEGDGFTRAIQQRLSLAFVNAREHGVKGDGVTNDDSAFATMVAVGAAVYYLPPGTYIVTGDVTFTDGSVVMAAGVTISGGALVSGGALTIIGAGVPSGGDLVGPAVAVDGNVVAFDTTTGKLVKDGAKQTSSLVSHTASTVDDTLAVWNGISGTLLKASSIDIADVGDFVGPATSIDGHVVAFDGTSGKLGKASGKAASQLVIHSAASTDNALTVWNGTSGRLLQNSSVQIDNVSEIAPGITAFSGASATFSAAGVEVATIDADATDVTDFTSGGTGQSLTIIGTGARTIKHGALIALAGSVDRVMASGSVLALVNDGSKWFEVPRA